MKLEEKDKQQIKKKGITVQDIEEQIKNFKNGFPYMKVVKAAAINKGIKLVKGAQLEMFKKKYEQAQQLVKVKFVPASGAATRMFKALFEFESAYKQSGFDHSLVNHEAYRHIKEFFNDIEKFAFYDRLKQILKDKGKNIEDILTEQRYNELLDLLLGEGGLNYRSMPKGLLMFHRYNTSNRTAVEEHMYEGAVYAKNADGSVKIHLTVSPEHLPVFNALVNEEKKQIENELNVKFDVTYSVQKPSTDTIAVDMENNPFRANGGYFLFRPAGHGALLENLNELDADIIFIKNIDNVVPDKLRADTVLYKKVLAGVLLHYREKIFNYLSIIEKEKLDKNTIEEIKDFISNDLCIQFKPEKFKEEDDLVHFFKTKLHRPIRVCGMVKNEGEPGGGPFWAETPDGTVSLQIVEISQIDTKDILQRAMLDSATHFNPVDIVCSIKDYKGQKFDLHKFRDPNTGFISKKSKNGIPLKAQELPGLWNGSMSDWNTIFVEVPIITFNPVKTINDLLRPEHQ